ncbi:winged helix-turn-helix domain-containing protein [Erythrobacter sp. HA6-11]
MTIDLAKIDGFELAGVRLEPRLRLVSFKEAQTKLEPRVMQVFVLLAQKAGNVVSRDEMVEQCWQGVIVGDDAIQRCIGRLRRLMSDIDSINIETIPKIGYRLVVEGLAFAEQNSGTPTAVEPALPSIGMETARFRGSARRGEELAQLLGSDITAALSLNRELLVFRQEASPPAEFEASIELRQGAEELRAHLTLTTVDNGQVVWSDALLLRDWEAALETGLPSDEWTIDIASRLSAVVVREVTQASLAQGEAQSSWQAVVRANAAYQRIDIPNIEQAIGDARMAVELDPGYAAAHAALANALAAHFEIAGAQEAEKAEEARKHCDLALALGPEDANVLAWTAHALLMITRPAEGLALAEKAVELAPWHPIANLYLARHYLHHGRPQDAEASLEQHARVAPLFPWKYWPLLNRGIAKFMLGDLEGSESYLKESTSLNPVYPYGWLSLAILGAFKSDTALMQSSIARLKALDGVDSMPLQEARIAHSYPDPAQAEMIAIAFRQAWNS